LLGIIGTNGRVGYLTPSTTVDAEFDTMARRAGPPEERFRFASPCVENGCAQWTGTRCGVIDAVLAVDELREHAAAELPRCAIRPSCRWFAQSGAAACAVCPLIITECR
jgi:hypothetical protein